MVIVFEGNLSIDRNNNYLSFEDIYIIYFLVRFVFPLSPSNKSYENREMMGEVTQQEQLQ